jgi:hypothetical protein
MNAKYLINCNIKAYKITHIIIIFLFVKNKLLLYCIIMPHTGDHHPSVFGPWPPIDKRRAFRRVEVKVEDDAVTATLASDDADPNVSFQFQSSEASITQNGTPCGERLLARTVFTKSNESSDEQSSKRIGQATYFFRDLAVVNFNNKPKKLSGSITVNSSNSDVTSEGTDKANTSTYRNFISGQGDFKNAKGFLYHESNSDPNDNSKRVVLYIRSL